MVATSLTRNQVVGLTRHVGSNPTVSATAKNCTFDLFWAKPKSYVLRLFFAYFAKIATSAIICEGNESSAAEETKMV